LDPWRDGRAAVGLRRRGESEVAALRRIGRARIYEDGGGSMARGRAAALDPWRDGRAARGPVATARRCYGASGGCGSTRTEASLWVGWLGTEE